MNALQANQVASADQNAAQPALLPMRAGGVGGLAVAVGAAYLVFIVGPPLLGAPVRLVPGFRGGDLLDLLTPLVVLPLVGLFYLAASRVPPSRLALISFAVASVAWVEGHAMHLAANAIGHHLSPDAGTLSRLVAYLDEDLSHQIWHGATIAIAAMTMYRAVRNPPSPVGAGSLRAVLLGGLLFGFTYFLMVVEGRTAAVALPAAAVLAIVGVAAARARILGRPALTFHVVGFVLANGLAVVWATLNDGRLVEFSEAFGF